ncbi:queuosine biosynthesis QueC ATPase [Cellulophaga phage phi47:1]|uniref:QueC-like queuosine biosynthesis n=1 Tax=Cellulophaga phage phiSM TaxID=756280 RepID=UPI0002B78E29|nr:QueC-like queuosine biosynthesis [Cellulophaga phage phiSM]AGF91620.1 queuosine biosynthesis protein QueC [Cellulophaga phage phi47:1]AGO47781.1 queuosine biosynthesis QueC ATPase [Cellulophaga phage phi3ST:2]AGO49289.1 queuosine biosynthesis QueC ATPase [Cellulophaga phage phi38:2]AGO49369.1 queuosine biosynthesis QueC ATPase [Cellulophaga phage phi3:1]AGH07799.1 queuosine biosynthesis protein QueC [Cellulophaga phage phiSM]
MQKTTKAVVIFSGGQDSTTCLFWALNRYDEVEAITFNYGQKHSVEIEQSKIILEKYAPSVKQTVIDISFLDTLVESALTSNGNVELINEKGLPASFVPNRNQLFITLSHAYAQKIGAQALVTGVCQTDYSGYPDCRLEFITALQGVTNLGSMSTIAIDTPLMHLNKAETFMLAKQENCLEAVLAESHTCYNGVRDIVLESGKGCGTCPACLLRVKGYEDFLHLERMNNPLNVNKNG